MLTNILIWILLGALAGWIASMIMGRNAQMGALANIVVGIVGALIGGFLIGGHFGMHSICGIFYPSAYRGNGAGWATSVAKIGSVAGPILGGLILSTQLPVRNIYAVLAVCPIVFALCIYIVGRMHSRILGRETAALVRAPAPAVQ